MKKSELRAIVAEIVKEELAKLEDGKVEETPAAEESAEESADEETKDEEVVEESAEEEPEQTTEQLNESCEDAEDCAELEEAKDVKQDLMHRPGLVKTGTYEDIAADIFNSDEFQGAFAIDGSVYGDTVNAIVEDAIISATPNLDDVAFEKAVANVTKYLNDYVGIQDDTDAAFLTDDTFADLDRIYNKHFDKEGNLY